jgi:hypothetical protein
MNALTHEDRDYSKFQICFPGEDRRRRIAVILPVRLGVFAWLWRDLQNPARLRMINLRQTTVRALDFLQRGVFFQRENCKSFQAADIGCCGQTKARLL